MKYRYIQDHRSEYCVKKMCRVLEVSQSAFYDWVHRRPSNRELENARLLKGIWEIHEDRDTKSYGSPRMTVELQSRGIKCSEPRVARLMRENGIQAQRKERFKVTTDSKHNEPISPNRLNQDFTADAPKRKWVSDLTYIWTLQGWLYLTIILDLFDRRIVGWALSERMHSQVTTITALKDAVCREHPEPGLIFHSDQGTQYADKGFRKLLKKHKMIQSMSGKGNCYDNAVAESFFRTLKSELIYRITLATRQAARLRIFEYIEITYNRFRRHSTLGYLSPVDYLNNYKKQSKRAA